MKLSPALHESNYKLYQENSFKRVDKWKAKIITGNSLTRNMEIDDWDNVGYIMISLKESVFIPIARSDEHHSGYDILYDMQEEWNIDPSHFYPIYNGNNYIFHNEEINKFIIAARKWLKNGGPDLIVQYEHNGSKYANTFSGFIESKDNIELYKNDIAPLGKKIINDLENISINFDKLRENPEDKNNIKDLKYNIRNFLKFIQSSMSLHMLILNDKNNIFEYFKCKNAFELEKVINPMIKNNEFQELEEIFFSYPGIKNSIHTGSKNIIRENNIFTIRDVELVFGKETAEEAMLRIAQIGENYYKEKGYSI